MDFIKKYWEGLLTIVLFLAIVSVGLHNSATQRRQRAATEATIAAQARHQKAADSVYFFTQGRLYERAQQLDENTHHLENLPVDSGLVWPAQPPRQ